MTPIEPFVAFDFSPEDLERREKAARDEREGRVKERQ